MNSSLSGRSVELHVRDRTRSAVHPGACVREPADLSLFSLDKKRTTAWGRFSNIITFDRAHA
ncbi:hypothetical protein K239x_25590 [Planctomycetes bacterium K23_9]|uniref:Uncharacterized protein n=1 Tax=Stieleria marina TaxID=1930275 RepID=A0A517NU18_9BACT|nr:hypothetical protein K239x_25590 [Planctomycetes bacterium K23_9]